MGHLIKAFCNRESKLENIFLDYEISVHNDVLRIFPDVQIKYYCR